MHVPKNERIARLENIKTRICEKHPQLSGFFVFSRINIYYFTGTPANGVLYVPMNGEPLLFVRKGFEKAKQECPFEHIYRYTSYAEIETVCADLGLALSKNALYGMETAGLTAQLAMLFCSKIKAFSQNIPAAVDNEIKYVRSIKSPYECEKIREAGKRQALALEKILPFYLNGILHHTVPRPPSILEQYGKEPASRYGQDPFILSEKNIAKHCVQIYTELEHGFLCRMSAHGEEIFYGHVACGDNLIAPTYYNGAMGFQGLHPALPCLGSEKVWQKGEPLCVDMVFNYEGYHTDKTQCYFYGREQDLPDEAKKAYECCFAVQELVLRRLTHGAVPEEIWSETLKLVEKFNFTEQFMGYKQNRVSFLGHGTGLSVDEFPVLAKNFKEPLQNSMIIACEPKIALPNFGMIGIENTFELIDNTVKNITSAQDGIIFIS